MSIKTHAVALMLILGLYSIADGQDRISVGFKAGLNTSTFTGAAEHESHSNNSGFHLGASFSYLVTDRFGLRGEFMYSQKGGDYNYNGPSFFFLEAPANSVLASGQRATNLDISNDYLDFPLMIFGRFGHFEVSGGFNVGFLIASTATGQVKFTGENPSFDEVTMDLDYSYFKDDPRSGDATFTEMVIAGGNEYILPRRLGAYYEYFEKDKGLYSWIDIGVLAGASIYLNEGLYIGARANWGLLDVSREETEVTLTEFDGNMPALQNDSEKQVSYQFSIGFSF